MGIKDLWSILQPYCERKPLYELQGKRVAIDLSGWVCQAQCIADYQVQPKMYLRNLYFRTCFLILHDVQMVFVLEGKAPTLKYKTIAARNELQFKGAAPRSHATKEQGRKGGRSRFDHTLKQCKEMLGLMGLACVTGKGEAEAMCAHLNKQKLVEGCISQDSDCFAYGADVVYRNFSISMQGSQASSGGGIDVYNLNICKQQIDFGRNKIIALALLCGSDYNEGVFGIGKESALRFCASTTEDKVLGEIRAWRSNPKHYERLEAIVNDTKRCAACSHTGKKAAHTRSGCAQCGTAKGCNVNEEHANVRLELQIRSKALSNDAFPDEELIGEFLNDKDVITTLNLSWNMPELEKFIDFTRKHLQWEEIYAFEKFFPILTRWLVHNPGAPGVITSPEYIKKKRAPKGIACYEIIWRKERLLPLIPPEQITTEHAKVFVSIEPQHLVNAAFPELVAQFNEPKVKSKAKATKKQKLSKNQNQKITRFVNTHDDSLFADVNDDYDADLSLIVEEICNRGAPIAFKRKINDMLGMGEVSFFDFNADEQHMDAFEHSLFGMGLDDLSLSSDDEEVETDD